MTEEILLNSTLNREVIKKTIGASETAQRIKVLTAKT